MVMVERKPREPDWDNPPYLRDRCRAFLEEQGWSRPSDDPYLEHPALDEDTDKLVKFVVEELYRAGAIY
jgi:hypothetical protein